MQYHVSLSYSSRSPISSANNFQLKRMLRHIQSHVSFFYLLHINSFSSHLLPICNKSPIIKSRYTCHDSLISHSRYTCHDSLIFDSRYTCHDSLIFHSRYTCNDSLISHSRYICNDSLIYSPQRTRALTRRGSLSLYGVTNASSFLCSSAAICNERPCHKQPAIFTLLFALPLRSLAIFDALCRCLLRFSACVF